MKFELNRRLLHKIVVCYIMAKVEGYLFSNQLFTILVASERVPHSTL